MAGETGHAGQSPRPHGRGYHVYLWVAAAVRRWRLQTVVVIAILAGMGVIFYLSRDFVAGARLFPQGVALLGGLLCLVELGRQYRQRGVAESDSLSDLSDAESYRSWADYRRGLLCWAYVAIGAAMLYGLGPVWGAGLFVGGLLKSAFKTTWWLALGGSVGTVAVVWLLTRFLLWA